MFDGADSWVLIADDGSGMTGSVLEEAMRYGTERTYDAYELGRFGLGLKTASLSQCRRLTVASRRGRERRRIEIRQWDLDHVLQTNRWEALRLDVRDAPNELVEPLLRRPGTTVLWEGLDRVLDYRTPNEVAAQHGLAALSQEVGAHVAMVFHRFLSGEARRRRRVRFTLNGAAIEAWDPYARSESQTRELTPQQIPFATERGTQSLMVRPYVLPAQERFSSAAAHARASGPQRWNRQQGFYFYRNDRLIQAGGWNRLRTTDEHTKLARVSVDLPTGCEALFRVNVAKMRVSLPGNLRGPMMAIASGVAAEAGASYRRGIPRSRPSDHAAKGIEAALPPLVSTLSSTQLDVLNTVIRVVREEFGRNPTSCDASCPGFSVCHAREAPSTRTL